MTREGGSGSRRPWTVRWSSRIRRGRGCVGGMVACLTHVVQVADDVYPAVFTFTKSPWGLMGGVVATPCCLATELSRRWSRIVL